MYIETASFGVRVASRELCEEGTEQALLRSSLESSSKHKIPPQISCEAAPWQIYKYPIFQSLHAIRMNSKNGNKCDKWHKSPNVHETNKTF
jgi:hypothetical protein